MKRLILFLIVLLLWVIPASAQCLNCDEWTDPPPDGPASNGRGGIYLDAQNDCGRLRIVNYEDGSIDTAVLVEDDGETLYENHVTVPGGGSVTLDDLPDGDYIVDLPGEDHVRHSSDGCSGGGGLVREPVRIAGAAPVLDGINWALFDVSQIEMRVFSGYIVGDEVFFPLVVSPDGFVFYMDVGEWRDGMQYAFFRNGVYLGGVRLNAWFGDVEYIEVSP